MGSFLPCLAAGGGGQQGWKTAFPRAGFSEILLRRWVAQRNLPGSDKRTLRFLNHLSIPVLNASMDFVCVCINTVVDNAYYVHGG